MSRAKFSVKKITKIKMVGERSLRDPRNPLKVSIANPIRTVNTLQQIHCKEVRIMEVGSLNVSAFNQADQMKNIRKVRLQREVLENPEMAGDLVKVQASGTYNAKGEVIQAVAGDLGNA